MSTQQAQEASPDTALHRRVAAHIRAGMAYHQVTQMEAAAMLGIAQQAVSARKTGRTPFRIDEIELLARRFGVTPSELIDGVTHHGPPIRPDSEVISGWILSPGRSELVAA